MTEKEAIDFCEFANKQNIQGAVFNPTGDIRCPGISIYTTDPEYNRDVLNEIQYVLEYLIRKNLITEEEAMIWRLSI